MTTFLDKYNFLELFLLNHIINNDIDIYIDFTLKCI